MERCCEPVEDNHACAIDRQMRVRSGVLRASEQPLEEGTTAHLASAGDSLAAAAEAALADLQGVADGRPGLTRSNRPASPTERRDAIPQIWRDDPEITTTALARRFGVSRRTIQYDLQALQKQGIQRPAPGRRRSQQTRAHYAAIYRRFLAWLVDELGRPPQPARSQRRRPRPLDRSAGERRRPRWPGTIVGVAAAGMHRPAPTCPPGRPPPAGRQLARLPTGRAPPEDHFTRRVRAAAPCARPSDSGWPPRPGCPEALRRRRPASQRGVRAETRGHHLERRRPSARAAQGGLGRGAHCRAHRPGGCRPGRLASTAPNLAT
jgi:HTH domain